MSAVAPESIRSRLTSISPELADDAEAALREALKTTKQVRANRSCVKCGCTHIEFVTVQDSPKVLEAIKLAIEQTEGRPGVAEADEAATLTVTRTVHMSVSAEKALELLRAGDLKALEAELLASLPPAHAHAREDGQEETVPPPP